MNKKTTLVLLPGLDGTEFFFGPLRRELPAWIETVNVAYPSSGPNAYEDLIPLVNQVLDSLSDCVLLGWSFGGPLALMVAAQRPLQVSGVILCSSFVTPPLPKLAPFRFAMVPPVIAFVRALRRTRLPIPGFASGALRHAKAMTWRHVNSAALASRARAALAVDARRQLGICRARILYLASTRDETISRASLNEVLMIAPQTEVAEVEGPHLALFTNPAKSAACIVDFLRDR